MNWLARLKSRNGPSTRPAEPTKPGFVGFVGTPDQHIQKIEEDAQAANDPAINPDRWCWPVSSAMNGAEIETFSARLWRFTEKGLLLVDAEMLADKLVIRDRELDNRRACLECQNLTGQTGMWRCSNWHRAGGVIQSRDSGLPGELVHKLQRCGGFTPYRTGQVFRSDVSKGVWLSYQCNDQIGGVV